MRIYVLLCSILLLITSGLIACGSDAAEGESPSAEAGSRSGGGPPGGGSRGASRGGPPGGFGGGDAPSSAIPVEVASVAVRSISDYIETNGTLEAENEVDLVARTMGPIVELKVEEGMYVEEGQLLARIDDEEMRAQLEIAKVSLEESRLAYERAKTSWQAEIISKEVLDQTKSSYDAAAAQIRASEIQLSYTEIRAPFSGLIIERVVKMAEHVSNGARLFRLSDFTPLLCEVQLPEKDLGRLKVGQSSYLTVEAFPDERFQASVLRVNPVVESATGTVRTTLAVSGQGRLRPGMFASVFLQVAVHTDALILPKEALVLESIGDTVFVVDGDIVVRREVEIGYAESDVVEIVRGVSAGEQVVVIGQDSLSDGTEVTVLAERPVPGGAGGAAAARTAPSASAASEGGEPPRRARRQEPRAAGSPEAVGGRPGGPPGRGGFDPSKLTPEMEEMMRSRMKQRGMTDEQIDERLKMMKEGKLPPGQGPGQGRPGQERPGRDGSPPGAASGSFE